MVLEYVAIFLVSNPRTAFYSYSGCQIAAGGKPRGWLCNFVKSGTSFSISRGVVMVAPAPTPTLLLVQVAPPKFSHPLDVTADRQFLGILHGRVDGCRR